MLENICHVSECLIVLITSRVKQNNPCRYKSCRMKSISHMQILLILHMVCSMNVSQKIKGFLFQQTHKQTLRDLLEMCFLMKLVWLMSRNYRLNWSWLKCICEELFTVTFPKQLYRKSTCLCWLYVKGIVN